MKIFQQETAFSLKMRDGELKFESEDEKKSGLRKKLYKFSNEDHDCYFFCIGYHTPVDIVKAGHFSI